MVWVGLGVGLGVLAVLGVPSLVAIARRDGLVEPYAVLLSSVMAGSMIGAYVSHGFGSPPSGVVAMAATAVLALRAVHAWRVQCDAHPQVVPLGAWYAARAAMVSADAAAYRKKNPGKLLVSEADLPDLPASFKSYPFAAEQSAMMRAAARHALLPLPRRA